MISPDPLHVAVKCLLNISSRPTVWDQMTFDYPKVSVSFFYTIYCHTVFTMVRVEGLEPPRLAAPEPKSGVSANSTIPASL